MVNKPLKTHVLTEKEALVQEIITMAVLANRLSARCFSVDYTGFINLLGITIVESEELFNDWLYRLNILPNESSVDELIYFREVLRSLINEEEIEVVCDNYALTGINFHDHRNDPPHVYEEDDED